MKSNASCCWQDIFALAAFIKRGIYGTPGPWLEGKLYMANSRLTIVGMANFNESIKAEHGEGPYRGTATIEHHKGLIITS